MAEQTIAKWKIQAEIQGERRQSQGRCQPSLEEEDAQASPLSHEPAGDTQININGFI